MTAPFAGERPRSAAAVNHAHLGNTAHLPHGLRPLALKTSGRPLSGPRLLSTDGAPCSPTALLRSSSQPSTRSGRVQSTPAESPALPPTPAATTVAAAWATAKSAAAINTNASMAAQALRPFEVEPTVTLLPSPTSRPSSAAGVLRRSPTPSHSSHYNFFAREVPADAVGRASQGAHQCVMLAKERQSQGKTAQLPLGHPDRDGMPARRLGTAASAPAFPGMEGRVSTPGQQSAADGTTVSGSERPISPALSSPGGKLARAKMSEKLRDCICEGFRVLILGESAPPLVHTRAQKKLQQGSPAHHKNPATKEQAIKVYDFYAGLLADAEAPENSPNDSDQESDSRSNQKDHCTAVNSQILRKFGWGERMDSALQFVGWADVFSFVEYEADLSDDPRRKSLASALHRALKGWRKTAATQSQRVSGISLVMLLQWTWPYAKSSQLAVTLTWIHNRELQKLCFPEPQVIQPPARRQLLRLFDEMDSRGGGFCTPVDIAGGDSVNRDEIKNIVDKDTVRAYYGEEDIGPSAFLELMCEDGYRGHEDATRVFLADGRRLVRHDRVEVGFSGWLLEDTPPEEEPKRKLVEALEAEVRLCKVSATGELHERGSRRFSTAPPKLLASLASRRASTRADFSPTAVLVSTSPVFSPTAELVRSPNRLQTQRRSPKE